MYKNLFVLTVAIVLATVSCKDDEVEYVFSATPLAMNFSYEGDSIYMSIKAPKDERWEAIIGDGASSWASFNRTGGVLTTSGEKDMNMWVYAEPNTTRYIKYDTLMVYDRSNGDEAGVVMQSEATPITFNVEDSLQYFTFESSSRTLDVTTNLDGVSSEIITTFTGCSVNYDITNGKIQISIDENTTPNVREAIIRFNGYWNEPAEEITYDLHVIQGANSSLRTDSLALVELNQTYSIGWETSKPVASWSGVELTYIESEITDEYRVTGISLIDLGLNGTFPDFSKFTYLQSLKITGNNFTGDINSSIYNINFLEVLWIGGGNGAITGTLSSSIKDLTMLRDLLIYETQINGVIPTELGDLENLTSLQLNDNYFTGTVPSSIGLIENLEYLKLNNNNLTGEIPSTLLDNISWYYWDAKNNILPQRNGVSLTIPQE